MKLEKLLRLDARDLVQAIGEVTEVAVLDSVEDAEHVREQEKKGSGRTTVFRALKDRRKELKDIEKMAERSHNHSRIIQRTTGMSKRTDNIAAKAKLAAENAEKEAKGLADKLAVSEAADREEALKSPADKAMERAFARGTLPEKDRRAPDLEPEEQPVLDNMTVSVPPPIAATPSVAPDLPAVDAFGVEAHPDTRPLVEVPVVQSDVPEGVPIPELVKVSPDSAETRGPLVSLVPLSEVHPSTVEAAVAFQQIPNDQINAVAEDSDGVKRDALGHPFHSDTRSR